MGILGSRLAAYWQVLNQERTLRIIFFSGNASRVGKVEALPFREARAGAPPRWICSQREPSASLGTNLAPDQLKMDI